jgi:hypothetical protein
MRREDEKKNFYFSLFIGKETFNWISLALISQLIQMCGVACSTSQSWTFEWQFYRRMINSMPICAAFAHNKSCASNEISWNRPQNAIKRIHSTETLEFMRQKWIQLFFLLLPSLSSVYIFNIIISLQSQH